MSSLFGDEAWRRLAEREREVLPRLVRPLVVGLLWLAVAVAFVGLIAVVAMLGELR